MTKLKFAKEWLDETLREIYKRELILEYTEKTDNKSGVKIDALKETLSQDKELVEFLKEWIKNQKS